MEKKKKRKLIGRELQAQRRKSNREQLRLNQFSDTYRAKMDAAQSGSTDTEVTEAPKEASFSDQMSTLFPNADERISSETFNQNLLNLQAMNQYADTGENEPINAADTANREQLSIYGGDQAGLTTTAGTEGAGIASTGAPKSPTSEAGFRAAKSVSEMADSIRKNPTAIQKRLMGDDMESGFTPERLARLVIKQQEYTAAQRKKPTLLKRLRGK